MNGRLVVTKEPQHAHHRLLIIAFSLHMQVLKGQWSSCWGSYLTTNLHVKISFGVKAGLPQVQKDG